MLGALSAGCGGGTCAQQGTMPGALSAGCGGGIAKLYAGTLAGREGKKLLARSTFSLQAGLDRERGNHKHQGTGQSAACGHELIAREVQRGTGKGTFR